MSLSDFRTPLRFVSVAATGITTVAKLTKRRKLQQVAKMLIVPPLIDYRDPLMVLGGLGHTAGDLVLLRQNRKLEQGAACFAAGHAAMILRQVRRGVRPQYPWVHAGLWLAAVPLIRDPKLLAYGALLAAYSSYSRSLGGPLFVLSDALIIANKRFPHPLLDAAVTVTYGSAQFMLFAPDESSYRQVN